MPRFSGFDCFPNSWLRGLYCTIQHLRIVPTIWCCRICQLLTQPAALATMAMSCEDSNYTTRCWNWLLRVARALLNTLVREAVAVQVWLWTLANSRPKWTEHVAQSSTETMRSTDNSGAVWTLRLSGCIVDESAEVVPQRIKVLLFPLECVVQVPDSWEFKEEVSPEGYQEKCRNLDLMRPQR